MSSSTELVPGVALETGGGTGVGLNTRLLVADRPGDLPAERAGIANLEGAVFGAA